MADSVQELVVLQMRSLAESVDGVGAALSTDGRDPKQMAAEAARRRAAGATAFCRVVSGDRSDTSPVIAARTKTLVQWAIAVPTIEGRASCLTAAYKLWDDLFRAAENTDLGMSWIARNFLLEDWELVYDSPQCAIVDLVMSCWIDLSLAPDLSEGSPLPTPAGLFKVQHSADGETWADTYEDGHIYAHFSIDGGSHYGATLRFQGAPGSGANAEQIQSVPVSETAPTAKQVLAYDEALEIYVPTDPAATPAAASEAEAAAGTETAVRSWSPLRLWQAVAGFLLSILTAAGTVLYRSGSGLAALTLRTAVRASGTADDTSLPTEAAVRALHGTHKLDATAAPTADDDSADGYHVGSRWIDTTADNAYVCMDAAEGAAVWQQINGSGSGTIGGSTGSVDNAILRTDGAGGATLQASDLAVEDGETGVQANVGLSNKHAGQTNSGLRLAPKGNGPIYVGPPADGAATGGPARGAYSVDLQRKARYAGQAATGENSFVTPGEYCSAPGANSIAGGYECLVSGANALALLLNCTTAGRYGAWAMGGSCQATADTAVAIGNAAYAHLQGQFAIGGGRKSVHTGKTQTSFIHAYRTIAATAATNLLIIGTQRIVVRDNTTWDCEIRIVGRQSDGTSAVLRRRCCIQRTGTTTALVGSVEVVGTDVFSAGLSGTTVAIAADDTNEALDIQITQPDTTSTEWLATIIAVEVTS